MTLNVTDEELRRGLEVSWKRARALRALIRRLRTGRPYQASTYHDVEGAATQWCYAADAEINLLIAPPRVRFRAAGGL